MNTATFPKSIEGVPYRWITQPLSTARVDGKTYKRGGRVAVIDCPIPGWADALIYQPDDESWWDDLPPDANIRAALRRPARNGVDLIGYALPLRNQPSELQAHIQSLQPQQLDIDPWDTPEPTEQPTGGWADAIKEAAQKRKRNKEGGRLADRRPHGCTDEALMMMLERIANAKGCRVCDVVNEFLWEGVNKRLQA